MIRALVMREGVVCVSFLGELFRRGFRAFRELFGERCRALPGGGDSGPALPYGAPGSGCESSGSGCESSGRGGTGAPGSAVTPWRAGIGCHSRRSGAAALGCSRCSPLTAALAARCVLSFPHLGAQVCPRPAVTLARRSAPQPLPPSPARERGRESEE